MERELGSEQMDLPHEFLPVQTGMCVCGRSEANTLHHDEPLVETAAASPALITEKGS